MFWHRIMPNNCEFQSMQKHFKTIIIGPSRSHGPDKMMWHAETARGPWVWVYAMKMNESIERKSSQDQKCVFQGWFGAVCSDPSGFWRTSESCLSLLMSNKIHFSFPGTHDFDSHHLWNTETGQWCVSGPDLAFISSSSFLSLLCLLSSCHTVSQLWSDVEGCQRRRLMEQRSPSQW